MTKNIKGDVCECGVYKGGTAMGMINLLQNSNKKLFLFDTFSGVPENSKKEETKIFNLHHGFNEYSYEMVCDKFKKFQNARIIKGKIEDTLSTLKNEISFSHIDLNYYNSTLYSLNYIYDITQKDGIILLDDYGFEEYKEIVKKAVDKFTRTNNINGFPVYTGQYIIIKQDYEYIRSSWFFF
jgi:O-methyltransferase